MPGKGKKPGGDTGGTTATGGIVFFGDSLSDNGNFNALAQEFFISGYSVPFQYSGPDGTIRTYSDTSFTDGTVYADTLAGLLSLGSVYENYAFGGAEALGSKTGDGYIVEYSNLTYQTLAGGTDTFSLVIDTDAALAAYGDFDINLAAQVTRYLDDHATPGGGYDIAAGTTAVLNIGANDLGSFEIDWLDFLLFGQVQDFADDLADVVETQARRLADAGVDEIALYTLPVAEFFLAYDDANLLEREIAKDIIDTVNDEILDRAAGLNADGIDTQIVRLDIIAEELDADMKSHGFLFKGPYLFGYSGDPAWVETANGIQPVYDVNAAATAYRADQILFFDEIHPSGALHDLLAIYSSETLTSLTAFGSGGNDALSFGGAQDFVLGRDGNDSIDLGSGDDVALGGRGNDVIFGRGGSDLMIGALGSDQIRGSAGADLLAGSLGQDNLRGGRDDDLLIGGLGDDAAYGDKGNDVFIFIDEAFLGGDGTGTETCLGGRGTDTIHLFLTDENAAQLQHIGTTLSFGNTTLEIGTMEKIVVHQGLPADAASLGLSGDLAERFDEAQLWGVV